MAPLPGFIPISLDNYVELHLKSNPRDDRAEIIELLKAGIEANRRGTRCDCGNPIWIIGSAFVGHACFTCITGKATPDSDYEIIDAHPTVAGK